MRNSVKCWKTANEGDAKEQTLLRIDGEIYALQDAIEEEIETGTHCLETWYVERKYKTQVCGPDHPRPYYDMKSERQELRFDELIFHRGVCIGAYHDGLLFLFEDPKTHYREKYLGEMPTGADQAITFYDYYYLYLK